MTRPQNHRLPLRIAAPQGPRGLRRSASAIRKLREARVTNAGWTSDLEDELHPMAELASRNWLVTLYCHPANGWEVVALAVSRGRAAAHYAGDGAADKLAELVGGAPVFYDCAALHAMAADLHEHGRARTYRQWRGKTIVIPTEEVGR